MRVMADDRVGARGDECSTERALVAGKWPLVAGDPPVRDPPMHRHDDEIGPAARRPDRPAGALNIVGIGLGLYVRRHPGYLVQRLAVVQIAGPDSDRRDPRSAGTCREAVRQRRGERQDRHAHAACADNRRGHRRIQIPATAGCGDACLGQHFEGPQ